MRLLLQVSAGIGVDFGAESDLDNLRVLPSHRNLQFLVAAKSKYAGRPSEVKPQLAHKGIVAHNSVLQSKRKDRTVSPL